MKNLISILTITALMLGVTSFALAEEKTPSIFDQANTGLQGAIDRAYGGGEDVRVTENSFNNGIISIINSLLTFTGVIFFIILIYAGWLWMKARGNEEQITKAKDIMRNVVIGLAVILMARLITELILSELNKATEVIIN